jgi:ribokinase
MHKMKKVIVVGGLNTDIIAKGVDTLLNPGELTRSGNVLIGPGGKSRNIAQMIAAYQPQLLVHMIGKTVRDPYGLWEIPYNALKNAGVNVDSVKILSFKKEGLFPGIALIPVDKNGRNQIYCLPGINDTLCDEDILKAKNLFYETGEVKGTLAISLEMPVAAAISALKLAASSELKSVVDPGGISPDDDFRAILEQDIFLLKPNEHEIEILSGKKVTDLKSATNAARALMDKFSVRNILITHGSKGCYLITESSADHFPAFEMEDQDKYDETGCGDQVTAVMAAEISFGTELRDAVSKAMIAGSLQFLRTGINPVTSDDVNKVKYDKKYV